MINKSFSENLYSFLQTVEFSGSIVSIFHYYNQSVVVLSDIIHLKEFFFSPLIIYSSVLKGQF